MSDQPPPEPDATQPFEPDITQQIPAPPPAPPPPPTGTQPLYAGGPPQPPRRSLLGTALVLLLGLVAGFVIAQVYGTGDELPTDDLVLYETASSTFPISGAAFTAPFDDPRNGTCDKEAFKRMLRNDPERFRAWLQVLELDESEFDTFVDRLVPKVLDAPTPVTNHGCLPGRCPFSLHSVLAPGTLVLVDPENGDRPVAKCRCGNPLLEPRCPPNCEDRPRPTPTPTATPTRTPQRTPTRTPTRTPPRQTPVSTPEATEEFPDQTPVQPPTSTLTQ